MTAQDEEKRIRQLQKIIEYLPHKVPSLFDVIVEKNLLLQRRKERIEAPIINRIKIIAAMKQGKEVVVMKKDVPLFEELARDELIDIIWKEIHYIGRWKEKEKS